MFMPFTCPTLAGFIACPVGANIMGLMPRSSAWKPIQGWKAGGESTPFGASYIAAHASGVRSALDELAPAVLGMDPRSTDRVNDRMGAVMKGQNAAKTALDVALWDIMGKAFDRPVVELLGGRVDGRIPVISSIGWDTPEAMRASVAAHRAQGFKGHSIKIGASEDEGGPKLDAERIKACLADHAEGEWFLVDANGGLSVEHGLRMLSLLPQDLDFVLEAPCASWAETMTLRQKQQKMYPRQRQSSDPAKRHHLD